MKLNIVENMRKEESVVRRLPQGYLKVFAVLIGC
jgi:hypothetical protein